jgi:hypothetical protein
MPSRRVAQKPLLTEKMKKKRMAFCKAYQHWTAEDWSKVMYSDESTFRCIRSFSTKVRRPSGSNRYDSQYTVKTVKHPDSVMIWGRFSGAVGRGGLFFLPNNTTMNAERTSRCLKTTSSPSCGSMDPLTFCRTGPPATPPRRSRPSSLSSHSRSLTGLTIVLTSTLLKIVGTL